MPLNLEPGEHVFGSAREAIAAIPLYTKRLCSHPGKTDQEHDDERLLLRPAVTISSPLVLLGGMGPLAGVIAFDRACRRFLDTRMILLLQACSIPDRTQAARESLCDPYSPAFADQADRLESAINQAASHLVCDDDPIDLIVLCNTSHFFISRALEQLSSHNPGFGLRIRLTSLIDSTIEVISKEGYQRVLALYTEGTRRAGLYGDAFKKAGFSYFEADEDLERSLMSAIYGVKAFDEPLILDAGTRLFNELLKVEPKFDCIVAACTEIPFIIGRLKAEGSSSLKGFLSQTAVVDPVTAALESLKSPLDNH